jgi:hypothetical protein
MALILFFLLLIALVITIIEIGAIQYAYEKSVSTGALSLRFFCDCVGSGITSRYRAGACIYRDRVLWQDDNFVARIETVHLHQ